MYLKKYKILFTVVIISIVCFFFIRNINTTPKIEIETSVSTELVALVDEQTQKNNDAHLPSNSAPVVPVAQRCQFDSEALKKHKQDTLIQFFKAFDATGFNKTQRDIVAYHAGLTLNAGREAAEGFSQFPDNELHSIENFANPLSPQEQKVLLATLIDKDYPYLIDLIEKKEFSVNKTFLATSMLSTLLTNDPQLNAQTINQLIKAGVNPTFSDAVQATKNAMPLDVVEQLFKHSNINTQKVWREDYQFESLASINIKNLNVVLLEFWISKGSPTSPEAPFTNALDKLPTPLNEDEQQSAEAIFILLMQQGLQPTTIKSVNSLKNWLPETLITQYEQQLTPITIGIPSELQPWIGRLLKITSNLKKQVSRSKACDEIALARASVQSTKKTPHTTTQSANESPRKKFEKTREQILAHTLKQNWETATTLAAGLANNKGDENILNDLLAMYIGADAPFNYIEALLQQNIPLPQNTIIVLARTNNVTLMRKLLAHNLDIYYKSDLGNNGITQSIQSYAKEMFDYLLSQGVDFTTVFQDKDALTIAIENVDINKKAIYYCRKLVTNNIHIKAIHVVTTQKLGTSNPGNHQLLLQSVPELQE
ncbi:MAG: hypothetical protein HRT35_14875 [Algicola sp.]|nr:hypothetical protein [Algicola sp.]